VDEWTPYARAYGVQLNRLPHPVPVPLLRAIAGGMRDRRVLSELVAREDLSRRIGDRCRDDDVSRRRGRIARTQEGQAERTVCCRRELQGSGLERLSALGHLYDAGIHLDGGGIGRGQAEVLVRRRRRRSRNRSGNVVQGG